MKLYFENSQCKKHIIATPKTEEEVIKEIVKFCDEHNFKIDYIRSWGTKSETTYDVGSWSEFFILERDNENCYENTTIEDKVEAPKETKPKRVNKTEKVLAHLEKHGSITSLEAIELYGATRLSAIIFMLRKRGYNIETIDTPFVDRFGTKSTYGKYILKEKSNEALCSKR